MSTGLVWFGSTATAPAPSIPASEEGGEPTAAVLASDISPKPVTEIEETISSQVVTRVEDVSPQVISENEISPQAKIDMQEISSQTATKAEYISPQAPSEISPLAKTEIPASLHPSEVEISSQNTSLVVEAVPQVREAPSEVEEEERADVGSENLLSLEQEALDMARSLQDIDMESGKGKRQKISAY